MQWHSSRQIPPFDRVLVTIASYFLNFPPKKTLHAIVVLNANPSLSKSSCHDCKSFSKLPPRTLHAMVFLNANPSLSKSSCHDCKSFSKLPPQTYMQWYSLMHILPFHRVLVTIACHFLNIPPKNPTCNISPQCKSFIPNPNPRTWKFPNPTLKFPNPGGKGKFLNPRAWKFPNPTLKFPNAAGKASFRIRGPGSFRIRR